MHDEPVPTPLASRAWQTLNFTVKLDGGNAFSGSGHLKVHIAGEVFHTLNVGENGVLIVKGHKPHGDAGHWSRYLYTAIHQGERRATHRGHGGGTVAFQHFALQ